MEAGIVDINYSDILISSSSLIPDMPMDEPVDVDVNDQMSDERGKQDIEFLQL